MKFDFKLLLSAKLPKDGFSLDELVIATKAMFETEGMPGFLKVLLEILDYNLYSSFLGKSEINCCKKSYLRVHGREVKSLITSAGELSFSWTRLKCKYCSKSFVPFKKYLNIENYQPKTNELEKIVTEIISEQSYRRTGQHLKTIGEISLNHQRIHRWVMKSDCDKISAKHKVQTIIPDGTGFKKKPVNGSNRGEVRLVIGVTKGGKVVPYGAWSETSWRDIGAEIKKANHPHPKLYFKPIANTLVSDGEPGMIRYLKKLATNQQRCMWHLPYELGPILRYQDNVNKEDSKLEKSNLQNIIEIQLPKGDFKDVPLEERLELEKQTWKAEQQVQDLINSFVEKGYDQAARYLINAKNSMFSYVRTWLKTGLVNPRVSSLIERMMREIGRRIKKIGHGWSPEGAAKMTRIIIKRITSTGEWNKYWEEKLKLTGKVHVSFLGCEMIS